MKYPKLMATGALIIGLTIAARAQVQTPVLAITPVGLSNVKVPKLTFHNSNSVAATAWIINSESPTPRGVAGRAEIVDTIINHAVHGIPPGADGVASALVLSGDAATRQWRLVAVLFADGTIAGDADWAREIVLSRQYEFQILTALTSDLASVKGMKMAEAIDHLEKSKKRQLEAANQARSAGYDRLNSLSSLGIIGHLYSAVAPTEFKSARVQFQAAGSWQSGITRLYTKAERALQDTSIKGSVDAQMQSLQDRLQSELHELSESRPLLSDPILDPADPR